jgi:hypothetical protein
MRFKLFALTNARPGREEEYERWSKDRHLADVLAVPGVISGECFRLNGPVGQWQYFTLYEVETDDPDGLLQEIRARVGTEVMPMSGSLDAKTAFMGLFEPR